MGLPQIISRNQTQKTNKRTIALVSTVTQPTTYYTCPTGKIAIVKGTCMCVDLGASASSKMVIGGISYATWHDSGGGNKS